MSEYPSLGEDYDLDEAATSVVTQAEDKPLEGEPAGPVAALNFHHNERAGGYLQSYVINAYDQFDIGREDIKAAFDIDEKRVSTHHLRFRCIVYGDDADDDRKDKKNASLPVTPMIYVRVLSRNPVRHLRHDRDFNISDTDAISHSDGDVLLNHGDSLQLTPAICISLSISKKMLYSHVHEINRSEAQHFADRYHISGPLIGRGGQASVFVAVNQSSKRQVACKVVRLRFASPQDSEDSAFNAQWLADKRKELKREFNILKSLSHPNIVKLEKVICAPRNVYIFQELITGGDLLSYITKTGALPESRAAVITRQLLIAVDHLHDQGIVHRDIKPENVLMTSWREGARIVLTDFGQARMTHDAKDTAKKSTVFRMQTQVGTKGYAAPEVHRQEYRHLRDKGYSNAIDIWSIGSITGFLLTDQFMFPDGFEKTHRITQLDVSFMEKEAHWTGIGRKAKAFIRNCVVADEKQRLTAKTALLDSWFTNKHYAAEIQAAYARAIADWIPQQPRNDLVEFIEAASEQSSSSSVVDFGSKIAAEVKNRSDWQQPPSTTSKYFGFPGRPQQSEMQIPSITVDFRADRLQARPAAEADLPAATFDQGRFRTFNDAPRSTFRTTSNPDRLLAIEDFAPPSQTRYQYSGASSEEIPTQPIHHDDTTQRQFTYNTPFNLTQYGQYNPSVRSQGALDESLLGEF